MIQLLDDQHDFSRLDSDRSGMLCVQTLLLFPFFVPLLVSHFGRYS